MSEFTEEERQRLESLFDRYFRTLVLYAERIIHDEQAAENIMLDVLLKVWPGVRDGKLGKEEDILKVLRKSTKHACLDLLKSRKRTKLPGDDLPPEKKDINKTANALDHAENLSLLNEAIDNLAPIYRQVIIHSFYKSLTSVQIGQQLKIKSSTIRTRKETALKMLREQLKGTVLEEMMLDYEDFFRE